MFLKKKVKQRPILTPTQCKKRYFFLKASLSQLKFRDSEGHCVQLQDLFSHGGQCSQEECNTIKGSIDQSILAVICTDTEEHQQHPQQLMETNSQHQETLGVPISDLTFSLIPEQLVLGADVGEHVRPELAFHE